MDDEVIVELYFQRNEDAIAETKRKYDGYCNSIAYNILASFEDTQECVSDVYLKTWNAIPPTRPLSLKGFLGRITHNLALDRYRQRKSKKCSVFADIMEEFDIPVLDEPGDVLERKELASTISAFIRTLPPVKQKIFLLRYWYYEPIKTISLETGLKEDRIKTDLYRMRKKLKDYLEQEGYAL